MDLAEFTETKFPLVIAKSTKSCLRHWLQSYLKGSDITDNCKAVTKRVW